MKKGTETNILFICWGVFKYERYAKVSDKIIDVYIESWKEIDLYWYFYFPFQWFFCEFACLEKEFGYQIGMDIFYSIQNKVVSEYAFGMQV